MTFIKAHTLALACGVVALLMLVAYFVYPIPGMFADVQTEVDKSKGTYDDLLAKKNAARTLPHTDLHADPGALPYGFPTRPVIKEGQEAIKRLGEQSQAALDEVIGLNRRPLLVPLSLPKPTPLARQQFYDAYRAITVQTGDGAENGIIRTILKGTLPPTEAELKEIGDARQNQITSVLLQTGADRKPVNQPEVDAAVAAMRARLPMEQRVNRAKSSLIYVSPTAVEIHPALKNPTLPEAETIFNAQFSLWLQQLVFEALADANTGATNVLDAPVKHLVSLNVPMEIAPVTASGAPAPDAAPPAELTPLATGTLTNDFTPAGGPFGYSHNAFFDPVQIQMVLRVDARKLPEILSTLGRQRLIKVRNVNFRTVDLGRALQEGYIYDRTGDTPMVEVTLDCDVLVLRHWLVPLMPPAVKAHFATVGQPAPV